MGEVMVRLSGWLMANKSQSAVANISALLLSPTSWINSHLYTQQQQPMPLKINAKINNTMILTPGTAQYQFSVSANARYGNFFATANTKPFDAFESTIGVAIYPKPVLKEFLTVGNLYSKEMNEYEQGGGPLIDIGTHALDLTLYLMDNYEPKMVVGNTFRKLADQTNTANAWGDWDPEKFTVEDSAFGHIVMKNGAVIMLESSWALNVADANEACFTLCGTDGGVTTKGDDVRVNKVKHGRQTIEVPNLDAGGVAFYDGKKGDASELDMYQWINAIINDTDPCVLPEQALCVTRILEAIYESAKTGKAVYFED